MDVLERAADFLWSNARLLERALFAQAFLGGPAEQVHAAVRAYRNADGGFGHALEPDLRCPTSQPLFAQIALQALTDAGIRDAELATGVCDFLAAVALPEGPVPIILPSAREYPRAAHWDSGREPDPEEPNPTAALVGLLL